MTKLTFQLSISAEEFLRYYSGSARAVLVRSEDGRRVQLPANSFRPFVTATGIAGRFEITLDEKNKLLDIRKL